MEILEPEIKPYKISLSPGQDERSFLIKRKNNSQTYYLDRGIAEGMSTTIQLQQAPRGVTKSGVFSSDWSSNTALVTGGALMNLAL